MKQEILAWLQGPRDFDEGRALYEKYGYNKMLITVFSKQNTQSTRDTLEYELAKLADVADDYQNLPRYAKKAIKIKTPEIKSNEVDIDDLFIGLAARFNISVDTLFGERDARETLTDEQEEAIAVLAPKYAEIPETQKKVIRFREQYPFLRNEDCPDELKIMVADMFSAYDNYREAYELLSPENPDAENFEAAQAVVENYLENRAMWAELDFYKENNALLGEHPIFKQLALKAEVKATPDIELSKKLGNARSNVTKNKNKIEAATDPDKRAQYMDLLNHWTNVEALYLAEIDERKNA